MVLVVWAMFCALASDICSDLEGILWVTGVKPLSLAWVVETATWGCWVSPDLDHKSWKAENKETVLWKRECVCLQQINSTFFLFLFITLQLSDMYPGWNEQAESSRDKQLLWEWGISQAGRKDLFEVSNRPFELSAGLTVVAVADVAQSFLAGIQRYWIPPHLLPDSTSACRVAWWHGSFGWF